MTAKIKWLVIILIIVLGITSVFMIQDIEGIKDIPVISNYETPQIPTDEDFNELYNELEEVIIFLNENKLQIEELEAIYQKLQEEIRCSRVNGHFNTYKEKYNIYIEGIDQAQERIERCDKLYEEYIELMDNIPLFSIALRIQIKKDFEKYIVPNYNIISEQKSIFDLQRAEADEMYQLAEEKADYLYNRDYDIMRHIVNAEGGWLDYSSVEHLYTREEIEEMKTLERCYIANVIENREISPYFRGTTVREVVFTEGQYVPVESGSIYKDPYEQTSIDMEEYLRGRIDTGMPDDVVWQAKGIQGKLWKETPSGHKFCHYRY